MTIKNCDTSSEKTNEFIDFMKRLIAVPKKEIDEQLKLERERKQTEKERKRK